MRPGARNLITDISGLRVGNADDENLKSGVTALICDVENVASVHVMGGAPGTRETDLLQVENTVTSIDAIALAGGSVFGLDAASGVTSELRAQGKGYRVHDLNIPIVPGAILFDLINGGDKDWGDFPPYRDLGIEAARNAETDFALGSHGAGAGALVGGVGPGLKGGLGSASTVLDCGITVGALVAVNGLGAPTMGESDMFWAHPFEMNDEFGGLDVRSVPASEAQELRIKFQDRQTEKTNTTIGIIATDAVLTKAQAKRLAVSAHDGFARALWPSHTPMDGDLIFAVATGGNKMTPAFSDWIELSAIAASTMSRAIARGVYEAHSVSGDVFPTWRERFG